MEEGSLLFSGFLWESVGGKELIRQSVTDDNRVSTYCYLP